MPSSDEDPPGAGASGSIEVEVSGPVTDEDPRSLGSGDDPGSGKIATAVPTESSAPHQKSKRHRMQTAVGEAVGGAVGKVGDGVSKVGEGVAKVGELSQKVPLVGAGISKLGEGIEAVGESIQASAALRKTRRGRLLIRSVVVGMLLVTVWIVAIVALQVRTNDTKDFRPEAIAILTELSNKKFDQLYDEASPRFQEITRKDRFVDDMTDLRATVGAFREIAAVNDTLETTGPSGKVGRVSLSIAFEKATCKSSVSFHYVDDTWKFLGIAVELPPELKISQHEREERIAACKDPMNPRTCDIHKAAVEIFESIDGDDAGSVWDRASPIFKQQFERTRFIDVQAQHRARLGKFRRVIAVSEAKVIGGTSATFDVLVEYEKSSGVRAVVGFIRTNLSDPWMLRSLKVVVPVPRAADGVRDAATGSGSGSAHKR